LILLQWGLRYTGFSNATETLSYSYNNEPWVIVYTATNISPSPGYLTKFFQLNLPEYGEGEYRIKIHAFAPDAPDDEMIIVTPPFEINGAPVANSQEITADENKAIGITLTATDVEGDPLTYSVVTSPAHGSLSGTASDVTYTPSLNYNGPDSFTFKANDGQLDSNTATITITVTPVNDAPFATADSYSTNEDVILNVGIAGVLTNDVDIDSAVITAVKVTDPAHGTLGLNANGSFAYIPSANWNGVDTFTYKANDGSLNSNVVTVSITVTPVNDAPVAFAEGYTTIKNTVLTVPPKGVLINDVDIDSAVITAVKVTDPAHGKVVLKNDGSFTYTPVNGYIGTDSFTYKVNDGLTNSNIATVMLIVKKK